jgi:hypothetical protein
MKVSEFESDPDYQKLPEAGKELFRKIMLRSIITGENPVAILEKLQEERARRAGEQK